ncbi:unnamed protein product, partial [Polarella glacialis]
YVPLITLGGFQRVRQMAPLHLGGGLGIIGLICQALTMSQFLELDSTGTKVRRRSGWEHFVLRTAGE